MLENNHYFYSELRGQKVSSLDNHIKFAKSQYDFHLQTFVRTVVRKPLGKLMEFFEGIEELLKTKSPEEVGYHLSYNRSALKKMIASFTPKEVSYSLCDLFLFYSS